MNAPAPLWSVPIRIDSIPESGRSFSLKADAEVRARIGKAYELVDLETLEAQFDVMREGRRGLRVTGTAAVVAKQACVVSLEPIETSFVEPVDLSFVPASERAREARAPAEDADAPDPPEELAGDTLDLGAIAIEFMALGLDPYPRKPDAVFSPPVESETETGPFAALAALKPPKQP